MPGPVGQKVHHAVWHKMLLGLGLLEQHDPFVNRNIQHVSFTSFSIKWNCLARTVFSRHSSICFERGLFSALWSISDFSLTYELHISVAGEPVVIIV